MVSVHCSTDYPEENNFGKTENHLKIREKKRKSLRFGMIHRPLLSKGFSILGLKLEDPTSGYILTFEFP